MKPSDEDKNRMRRSMMEEKSRSNGVLGTFLSTQRG
jgi:hypothetical protein